MGVTGLLQQLKEIQEPTSLSAFRGKTLAVDTYGWLHRGLVSCAQDLCTDAPTSAYVTSVMKKVDMLRHFGVEPYMVFDGAPLPTKEGTAMERREKRERARAAASALTKKGDRRGAWKEYMKAAAVTPEMAKSVMVELDRRHVQYVVAPYEADPQMVYLEKIGAVDGILSEDSDLLVFGCNRLVTKLNDYGECIEICRANFARVTAVARLDCYTAAQWRAVAILAGCDYTKGVPGVGLKTAFAAARHRSSLPEMVQACHGEKRAVPPGFLAEAVRADLAFQFQKVFDPAARAVRTLTPCPAELGVAPDVLDAVCGRALDPHVHAGICTGRLHPSTHAVLVSREQNLASMKSRSMVERGVRVGSGAPSGANPPPSGARAQSFAFGAKTIESYFKAAPAPAPVLQPSKRVNGGGLSPTAKKLRKMQPDRAAGAVSKFFDPGYLTGDSEVPESSPVKDDTQEAAATATKTSGPKPLSDTEYLTDDDLDIMPVLPSERSEDDGYTNELDESPVKRVRLGQMWRQRFSMGPESVSAPKHTPTVVPPASVSASTKSVSASTISVSASTKSVSASTISVSASTASTTSRYSASRHASTLFTVDSRAEDTASSSGPSTPRNAPPTSSFKSSQISESDDEPRPFSLSRFAFRP